MTNPRKELPSRFAKLTALADQVGNDSKGKGGDSQAPKTESATPQTPETVEQPPKVQVPAPVTPEKPVAKKPKATASKPKQTPSRPTDAKRLVVEIKHSSALYSALAEYRAGLPEPFNEYNLSKLLLEFLRKHDDQVTALFKKSVSK